MDTYFKKNDDDDDSFIPTFVALDRDEPSGPVGSMEPFDIDECEHDSATSTTTPNLVSSNHTKGKEVPGKEVFISTTYHPTVD